MTDLFADEEDAIVALHLLDHGGADSLTVTQFRGWLVSLSSRERSRVRRRFEQLGAGLGALFGELHGVGDLVLDLASIRRALASGLRL